MTFRDIWSVGKDDLPAASLERAALTRAPDGGWLLYLSYEPPDERRWRIDVLHAADPSEFDLASRRAVLAGDDVGVDSVKDPFVVRCGPVYFLFMSTFLTADGPAPTSVATSLDGVRYAWHGTALPVGSGWDRYQARLTTVAPVPGGFIGWYDGGAGPDEDTEERCGLAWSGDLLTWRSLTPDRPWRVSPHASGSLRYVALATFPDGPRLYYEYARPDAAHELRTARLR